MARTKKVILSPAEQLEKTIVDIEATEIKLKELKKLKKDLEKQVKINRLAELDELITASGKSLDEVKALLSEN